MKLLRPEPNDVIYMDPPWGSDYVEHESVRIRVGKTRWLEPLVSKFATKANTIVLKLPRNYDLREFAKRFPSAAMCAYDILKKNGNVYMMVLIIQCRPPYVSHPAPADGTRKRDLVTPMKK